MPNMIIVKPGGGICNRIRVINSCIALMKRNSNSGHKIKMIWEKNNLLNCDFYDLFQEIGNIQLIKSSKVLEYFLFYNNTKSYSIKSRVKKYFLSMAFQDYKYFDDKNISKDRFNPQFWDNLDGDLIFNTCEDFYLSEVENNYKLFKPIQHLKTLIDQQVEKFVMPTTGVHIRRTDNIVASEKSPTRLFIKHISNLLEKDNRQLFYLSTDDLSVEEELKYNFGKHILIQENKELSRDSKKGIEDAMVDLYALSNTNSILGSYWSSFSGMAAWLNRIPLYIVKEQTL